MQIVPLKIIKNKVMHFETQVANPKNVVLRHLNINSLRNTFEAVEKLVQNKVDICFLSETKIDKTFSNQQVMINGYKLFRRDKNCHGGSVLRYINETIPSKLSM